MTASSRDRLAAVVARQRGRARLRAATIAFGAASLVTAGAVAYHLPGATTGNSSTTSNSTTATSGTGTSATVHTTTGGSGVAAASTSGRSGTPASSAGTAHATSGGS